MTDKTGADRGYARARSAEKSCKKTKRFNSFSRTSRTLSRAAHSVQSCISMLATTRVTAGVRPCHRLAYGSGATFRPAQQGSKQRSVRSAYPRHITRATEDSDQNQKRGLDWDSAWSNFKDGLNKNIPQVEDRTARSPEPQKRTSSKSPQFAKDSRRQLRENIKKQEDVVLDFWSQELFFKAGGAFIAVLLVIFLVIGGPSR